MSVIKSINDYEIFSNKINNLYIIRNKTENIFKDDILLKTNTLSHFGNLIKSNHTNDLFLNDLLKININDISDSKIYIFLSQKNENKLIVDKLNNIKKFINNISNNDINSNLLNALNNMLSTMIISDVTFSNLPISMFIDGGYLMNKYFLIKTLAFEYTVKNNIVILNNNTLQLQTYIVRDTDTKKYNFIYDQLDVDLIKNFLYQEITGKYVYYVDIDNKYNFKNLVVSDNEITSDINVSYNGKNIGTIEKSKFIQVSVLDTMETIYDVIFDFEYFYFDKNTGKLEFCDTADKAIDKISLDIFKSSNTRDFESIFNYKQYTIIEKIVNILDNINNELTNKVDLTEIKNLLYTTNPYTNNLLLANNSNELEDLNNLVSIRNNVENILKSSSDYERLYSK